jgi:hypothetical protein
MPSVTIASPRNTPLTSVKFYVLLLPVKETTHNTSPAF